MFLQCLAIMITTLLLLFLKFIYPITFCRLRYRGKEVLFLPLTVLLLLRPGIVFYCLSFCFNKKMDCALMVKSYSYRVILK